MLISWKKRTQERIFHSIRNTLVDPQIAPAAWMGVTAMIGWIEDISFFYVWLGVLFVGLIVSTVITQVIPWMKAHKFKKSIALYQARQTLSLWEAACLWVGVLPQHPLVDHRARAKLGDLKEAVRHHKLDCTWLPPMTMIHDMLWGIRDKSPTDEQEVSKPSLRQYADKIKDVPSFLRDVPLPVESPQKEDNEKPPAPSTD